MSDNSQSFLVVTDLDEADWHRAAESRWSSERDLLYDLLLANVTIVANGQQFLPKTGLAIADFALGLNGVLEKVAASQSGSATSVELCGEFYIEYAWNDEQICLKHSFGGKSAEATISRGAFVRGAMSFLRSFAAKGRDTIPAFFDWNGMKDLEGYVIAGQDEAI